MDFGIGEVLEKFEKHFGARTTRVLLGIIGLSVVGVCLGLIWEHLIYPLYEILQWLLNKENVRLPNTKDAISAVLTGLISVVVYFISSEILRRRAKESLRKLFADAREEASAHDERMKRSREEFIMWYMSLDVIDAVNTQNNVRVASGLQPIKFPSIITDEKLRTLLQLAREVKDGAEEPASLPKGSTPTR